MLEQIKSILFLIVALVALALLGYWAVTSLQSGSEYKLNQHIEQLQNENDSLKKDIKSMTDELNVLRFQREAKTEIELVATEKMEPVIYKYQSLIDELQKLIQDNIFMKVGSRGTRVETVQKFLNIYNNKTTKIDNDYGAGTKNAVMAFQKAVGISSDGQAGAGTFSKMIDWLKKQG